MRLLFIGDIIGRGGRRTVAKLLPALIKKESIDLVIANGENSAAGFGLTAKVYQNLTKDMNIDVLTSGNHIWDKKELIREIDNFEALIRPANYPAGTPGVGYRIFKANGNSVAVINLLGRVFLSWEIESPFVVADNILKEIGDNAQEILVDIHAEATSEKVALAKYLDGRVTAVIGTHTHVQTADERVMSGGTAFISDAGMVGGDDSIIGMDSKAVIRKFLTGLPQKFEPVESGKMIFNAVLVETNGRKATGIRRISEKIELAAERDNGE